MGGVDLSEMLIELYRTDIRGKKWYESLLLPLGFFSRQHTVDLSASYGSARPNPLKEPLRLQKRNRLTFTFTSAQLQDLIEDPSKTKTVPLQIDQSLPNQSHMIVFTMKASSIGRMQWLIRSNAGAALLILESNVQMMQIPRPRGRPLRDQDCCTSKRPTLAKPKPYDSVHYDSIQHWPDAVTDKKQSRLCSAYARIQCSKCQISLCLVQKRNCFKIFHTQ
ncbi:hypothetical protein QYM36_015740 [Artemia franciscana]|uniref:PiggyBac transposable element-derived protein domain-containing protein n=1 Tax=Artemia franciscana TaxID=6661 RepID=A0AA88HHI2_ARTSF|nr:hypothetical protein QYM36_015740 [Artemia franciscana]